MASQPHSSHSSLTLVTHSHTLSSHSTPPCQGEAAAKVELTSAGLLNLLVARQRSLAGDRQGQALVGQLLEAAAEPYFGILRQWMCSGVLDDPYGEFMVKVG